MKALCEDLNFEFRKSEEAEAGGWRQVSSSRVKVPEAVSWTLCIWKVVGGGEREGLANSFATHLH